MREIPLTRGYVTIVDDEWFDALSAMRWHAVVKPSGKAHARACISNGGTRQYIWMHRRIVNAPHHLQVDHRDGDGLNNIETNLRFATNQQNAINRNAWGPGLKGVQQVRPGCFQAKITIDRRKHCLGSFKSEIEAALAYDRAAKQWHGEFANLNFPDSPNITLPFTKPRITGEVGARICPESIRR